MYSRFKMVLQLAVACAIVICGCSRDSSPVVAEVNGHVLRESEVNARATNIAALFLHKTGKIDNIEKIKEKFRSGYAKVWVEDRVLEDAAKADGVEVAPEHVEKCRKAAFRNFKAKGDSSYEDLVNLPGFTRELWEDQVLSEARRKAMKDHWAKVEPANIPDDYADKVLAKIAKWNENMAKTNALQFAKASNVWEKLRAGADFVKTARVNTEKEDEIEDDCEWGTIDDKFLADDPALYKQLKSMKVGEFSPPVEGDGGILIVRLDSIDEDDGYTVSRIFFHKGNVLTPAPKKEIVATAERKYVDELFRRKLGELMAKANVRIEPIENKEQQGEKRQ